MQAQSTTTGTTPAYNGNPPNAQTTNTSQSMTTSKSAANAAAAAKTTDKVNTAKKGPIGETVYIGPKGGNYYFNKNTGKKAYMPK